MEITKAKQLVIKAGRELSESGLIARTWGNVSCRVDENTFVITASGRNYMTLTEDEVIPVKMVDLSYEGDIKPSSEKKVHRAVYLLRPEADFIIHTHQDNASAVSAAGIDVISFGDRYEGIGREVICAEYGLPGTDRLCRNTARAVEDSCGNAVIMKHHGTVCWGRDYEQAFTAARSLEDACGAYLERMGVPSGAVKKFASYKKPYLRAYLDDYAQIVGPKMKIRADENGEPVVGNAEDAEAMKMIINKNCRAYFAAMLSPKGKPIGMAESILMRRVYLKKYSRLAKEKS